MTTALFETEVGNINIEFFSDDAPNTVKNFTKLISDGFYDGLQTVGWSRRPIRRVKRALDFSILVVGLWRHDDKFPRLVGFARCTGDGILEATVWDVAINPVYQGLGLGKELMKYILKELKNIGISKVTLFADAEVVSFYKRQGWILEPRGSKCAFWYAN